MGVINVNNLCIGDRVTIGRGIYAYTNLRSWVNQVAPNFVDEYQASGYWEIPNLPQNGENYVIVQFDFSTLHNKVLYLIEDLGGERVYVVDERAFSKQDPRD